MSMSYQICEYETYGWMRLMIRPLLDSSVWTDSMLDYYCFFILQIFNFFIYEFFYISYLTLGSCFALDLYQTIKNPLYPPQKRLVWYLLINVATISVCFVWENYLIRGKISRVIDVEDLNYNLDDYRRDNIKRWEIVLIIPIAMILLFGLLSILKAVTSLSVPGIGQRIRN